MINEDTIQAIHQCILRGDSEGIPRIIRQAVENGEDPLAIIEHALNPALKEVGNRFDAGDLFLPELILAAEVMQAAVGVLQPYLEAKKQVMNVPGRVVMATVQGDIHDIGKNIVSALLRANGFEVLDLGRDVTAATIVAKAQEFNADIIGLSALLSTTLPYCRDTVRLLDELGLRERFKVFIGGGSASPAFAESINAIYGGPHAEAGVQSMLRAMGRG
ncbi:MAG TPA: corrinoid protein [Anaerolineales bacterium]|nr:corrinoid protein [Anaerolineales bacterium]